MIGRCYSLLGCIRTFDGAYNLRGLLLISVAGLVLGCLSAGLLAFQWLTSHDDPSIHHLHAILRPDPSGQWYIQNDATHAPHGFSTDVVQGDDYIRVFTGMYTKAGTIQISTDDGFGDYISGHANLGLNTAVIEIRYQGEVIDPAEIWSYLPPDRRENQNGNFWVNITMIE